MDRCSGSAAAPTSAPQSAETMRPRSEALLHAIEEARRASTSLVQLLEQETMEPGALVVQADAARRAVNELWTLARCDARSRYA